MDFIVSNRPKLPRNHYGWVGNIGGNSTNIKGGSGLDSKTLNSLYDLIDWFYKDGDFVHSKYSFVGDYEVAAYNNGSIIDGGSYNASWIDSSYLYILDLIDQLDLDISIDGSIDLTDFAKRNWVQNNFPDNSSVSATYVKNVSFNSYIETLNSSINEVEKWFWLDGSNLNTSFNIIGHGEVAAYDNGSIIDGGSYNASWIDSSYMYIINLIDNISIGGGGEGGTYITDVSISQWDNAANLAHTHGNKAILDGITDSSISLWNETAENLNDWFFFDNDTSSVVTPYNLRSQKEITAYNTGDSSDADAYPRDWSDASYQFLMDRIDNISINIDISDGSIDLSGLAKKTDLDDVSLRLDNVSSRLDNVSSRVDDLSVFVDTLNTSVNEIEKWWWLDGSTINTSFHIVGYGEINAYGQGQGGSQDSYTQEYIDTQFNNIINMIENISTGGDITIDDISGFVKDVSFNKLVDDVCNGFSGMSGDINNVSTRVNDLSIYVDGLNVNINDVSNKLNSWFYLDSSGNLNTSLNLIGHKEVMAWGQGDSSEINLAGYVTSDYLEDNYYNKAEIDGKIAEGIDGSIDLSGYVTMIHLEDNYPDNASVWENYVHNVSLAGLNSSLSEINTSINDISSRVNTVEGWFYLDASGNLNTSLNLIGHKEIMAWGQGDSSEINLAGYAKLDDLSNYYNKSEIDQKFNTIELDDYVKVSDFNTATNDINASIHDLRSRIADVSQGVIDANADITLINNNITATNATVDDLSTRMNDVSAYSISVSTRLGDFFYWDNDTSSVVTKHNLRSEKEITAYKDGSSGPEVDYSQFVDWTSLNNNYYTKSEVSSLIDNKMDSFDLTPFATQTWVNSSLSKFATQSWVNTSLGDYVKKTDFNSSFNELKGDINNANASITEIKSDILTVNGYINNLNDHINDVDNTLNDWFYFQNGKLFTKYDFISQKEICAYKDGSSGQDIDFSDFITLDYLEENYMTRDQIQDAIGDIDFSGLATISFVNSSIVNISNTLGGKINDVSNGLFKKINDTSNAFKTYIDNQDTSIVNKFNDVSSKIVNKFNDVSSKIVKKFNDVSDGLFKKINDTSNALKSYIDIQDTSIVNKFNNVSNGLNTKINNVSTLLHDWFKIERHNNTSILVTTYPFASYKEINAYGVGQSSSSSGIIDMTEYAKWQDISSNYYTQGYSDHRYVRRATDIDMLYHKITNVTELQVNDLIYTPGTLNVEGNASIDSYVTINASLWVNENTSVNGALQVSGKTTVQNVSAGGPVQVTGLNPIIKLGNSTTTGNLNCSIIFGGTTNPYNPLGAINVYRKTYNNVNKYDMDIMIGNKLELKAANVSINAGVISTETKTPVFRLGKVTDSAINASLYFGSNSCGYINVSTLLDDDELKHDMTIAAGRNIDLKCENINLVADTTVDGGLSVNGAVTATGGVTANGAVTGSGNLQLNSRESKITLGSTVGSGYNSSIIFGNTDTAYINVIKDPSFNRYDMYLYSHGKIDFTAPNQMTIHGRLYVDGDFEWDEDSDRRLKSDIKPLEYRGPLKPVEYNKSGKHQLGFIAQDVQELYPDLVVEKENGYLGLNYPHITAVLAAQVNEQNKIISALTERLNQIEKLLNK